MEKSYIDREALKRVYMGKGKDKLRLATVINELELAPAADVVEVVRCKDCKHCDPENGHCDHTLSTSLPFSRKPDDYCSYGERRKT